MYREEKLNYTTLKPVISDETLFLHYNKHYMNYLNKLNELLIKNKYKFNYTKEELVNHIDIFELKDRGDILYNLGGVLNHELYFKILGGNGIPNKEILTVIESNFESFDNFKNKIKEEAKKLVGSGYIFVVINKNKGLQIISLSNQDTPYSYNLIPIMAIDLWEHSYYLDYFNKKSEYVDNILTIIDYNKVNEIYQQQK